MFRVHLVGSTFACLLALGAGDAVLAAQDGPSVRFVKVAAGGTHSCALTDEGAAYCWGADYFGNLGNGTALTEPQLRASPVEMPAGVRFTTISVGGGHSCALATDGRAYCWGPDLHGEVGDGAPAEPRHAPVPVAAPAGTTFQRISAGLAYTCGVTSRGQVYCWGVDRWNVLGHGGRVSGDQPAPLEVVLPAGVGFTEISAGHSSTCGIGDNGRAYCWGMDEEWGGLGDGRELRVGGVSSPVEVLLPAGVVAVAIASGAYHGCLLAASGKVYCWGHDQDGQLGNGPGVSVTWFAPAEVPLPGLSFTALSVGAEHTCALEAGGTLYCWGNEYLGRLGTRGERYSGQTPAAPAGERTYTSVSAGHTHTCAADADGRAYCWGEGAGGKMGNGYDNFVNSTPGVVLLPGDPEYD
jgi:alpha-tubulin suppressor-like RCC1 family protein